MKSSSPLVLGGMLLANVRVLNQIRKRRMDEQYLPGRTTRGVTVKPARRDSTPL